MLYHRIRQWVSGPRGHFRVAACVVLASLPSLAIGLQADDYDIAAQVEVHALGAYAFDVGDPATVRDGLLKRRDAGLAPWWIDEGFRQTFFRPLASITHWLDFTLFTYSPWVMHLGNVLLYGLLVLLAGSLYLRLDFNRTEAGLATLFYGFNAAQSMTVGWISGRNTLLAAMLGVLCVGLHARSRRAGGVAMGMAAWSVFGLALLSSEGGIAALAYLVAFALVLDDAPLSERVRSVMPYLLIVVLWRWYYVQAGHTVSASAFYVDFASDPLAFVRGMAIGVPVYLGSQLTVPFANLTGIWPGAAPVVAAIGCGLLLLFSPLWLPMLRSDRQARFLALGALLSTLPLAATMPQDRLVFFVGLGMCGLVARIVVATIDAPGVAAAHRFGARMLLSMHGLWAPILFVPLLFSCMGAFLGGGATALDQALPDDRKARVVLINSPTYLSRHFSAIMRTRSGRDNPASVHMLYAGNGDLSVHRRDDRTLEVAVPRGWLATVIERVVRDLDKRPFRVGDEIPVQGMTARVQQVNDSGAPERVRFRFDSPLEELTLMYWTKDGPVLWPVPAIGATAELLAVSPF